MLHYFQIFSFVKWWCMALRHKILKISIFTAYNLISSILCQCSAPHDASSTIWNLKPLYYVFSIANMVTLSSVPLILKLYDQQSECFFVFNDTTSTFWCVIRIWLPSKNRLTEAAVGTIVFTKLRRRQSRR